LLNGDDHRNFLTVRVKHRQKGLLCMKQYPLCTLVFLGLMACGSTAPNTNASDPINVVGTTSPNVSDVRVVSTAPQSAIELSGIDCRNKVWDPVPTGPRAIEALKAQAKQLGKYNVVVRSIEPHPAPISINCWSATVARGLAY
jgi:hypothetical protein